MKTRISNFTLIEILVVTAIISVIMGISLAALQGARDQARFGRWLAYSSNIKADPDLIAYYNFQEYNPTTLKNLAFCTSIPQYDQRKVDATLYKPQWCNGRWKHKGALRGNGLDGYFMINPENKIKALTKEFSFEIWFYLLVEDSCTLVHSAATFYNPTTLTNAPKGIAKKLEPVSVNVFNIERYSNKIVLDYVTDVTFNTNPNNRQGGGGGYAWGTLVTTADITTKSITLPCKFNLRQWYHLVLTYSFSNGKITLYLNGQKVAEQAETTPIVFPFETTYFGGDDSAGCSINGIIDEVGIYGRALSPYDVKAHYIMGAPR